MGWHLFKKANKQELKKELEQQLRQDAALQEQLSHLGELERSFRTNDVMHERATQRLTEVRAGFFTKEATITAHQQLCDELAEKNPALYMKMQTKVAKKVSQTYEELDLSDQTTLADYREDYGKLGIEAFDFRQLFKNEQERSERVNQLLELLDVVATLEREEQQNGQLALETREQLKTRIQNLKQRNDSVANRIPQEYFDPQEDGGVEFLTEEHPSILVMALKNAVLGELYQEAAACMQQDRSSVDMDAFRELTLQSQLMNLLTQRIPVSTAYTTDLAEYRRKKEEHREAEEHRRREEEEHREIEEYRRQEEEERREAAEFGARRRQREKRAEINAARKRRAEEAEKEAKEAKKREEEARKAEERRKREAEEEARKKQELQKRKDELLKEKRLRYSKSEGRRAMLHGLTPELENLKKKMEEPDYKRLMGAMDAYLHGFGMNPETNKVFSVKQASQAMMEWQKRHNYGKFALLEKTTKLFDDPKAAEGLLRHHYFVACDLFRYMSLVDLHEQLSVLQDRNALDEERLGKVEIDALEDEITQLKFQMDAYGRSAWSEKIRELGDENKKKEADALARMQAPAVAKQKPETDAERALREQAEKLAEEEQQASITYIKKQIPYTEDPLEKLPDAYRRLAEFFGVGRVAGEVPDEEREDDAKGGKYLTLEHLQTLIKEKKINEEKLTYAPEAMEQMVDIRDLDRLFGIRRSPAQYLVRLENDDTIAEVRASGANELFEVKPQDEPWDSSLPMNRDFVTKLNNYRLGKNGLSELLSDLLDQDRLELLQHNIEQAQTSIRTDLPDVFRKEDYEDNTRLNVITKKLKRKQPELFGEKLTNEQVKGTIVHTRNRIGNAAFAEYTYEAVKPEDQFSPRELKKIRDDCAQADEATRICAEHLCKNENEERVKEKLKPLTAEMIDRSREPLFEHMPCPQDIKQGHLGDCYVMSSLIAITKENPKKITDMMQDMGDIVQVKFWNKTVYVSKKICKPYSSNGALWVQIMEKAYAQTLDAQLDVNEDALLSDDYLALQEKLLKGEAFQTLSPEQKDAKIKELYAKTVFKTGEGGREYIALNYLLGYNQEYDENKMIFVNYHSRVNGAKKKENKTKALANRLWQFIEQDGKNDPQWYATLQTLQKFLPDRLKKELEYRLGINMLDDEAKITETQVDGELVKTGKRKRSTFRPLTINDICEALTDILNWMDQDGHVVWAELLLELKKTAKQPDDITKETLQQYMKRLSEDFVRAGEKQDILAIEFRTQLDDKNAHYTPHALEWFDQIKKALHAKQSIVCATTTFAEGKDASGLYSEQELNGLEQNHAYQVTDVYEGNGHKYITVTNPWGRGIVVYTQRTRLDGTSYTAAAGQMEDTEDGGTFDLELNDFMNNFEEVAWEN